MNFFYRLRALFRKEELNNDLSDELAFHLEKQVEQNVAAGMRIVAQTSAFEVCGSSLRALRFLPGKNLELLVTTPALTRHPS